MRIAVAVLGAILLIGVSVAGTLGVQALVDSDEPTACEFLTMYYEVAVASEPTPEPDIQPDEVSEILLERRKLEVLRDVACGRDFLRE